MEIKYIATGSQRKEMVKAISDVLGIKAKYMGMPTAAYTIDYFTVTKDGTLLFDDRADSEEVEKVLTAIANAGFECEVADSAAQEGDTAEEAATPEPRATPPEDAESTSTSERRDTPRRPSATSPTSWRATKTSWRMPLTLTAAA